MLTVAFFDKTDYMNNTSDNNNENTPISKKKCRANKLECYDWLSDLPESHSETEMVEVQFKNTRKGYYKNSTHIHLEKGDMVAVEGNPGHDIGEVTLTGRLVLLQMKKKWGKIG